MTVVKHAEYPNSYRLWKQWAFITPCEFERHALQPLSLILSNHSHSVLIPGLPLHVPWPAQP